MSLFVNTFIKFFFLLTPFFVLSTFLSLTRDLSGHDRRTLAMRILVAVVVTSLVLFFFGNYLFAVLGITLDAFRIGAGSLLFLSGVALVYGRSANQSSNPEEDIAVVPLAIPVTVGPATTGALLVMGVELTSIQDRIIGGLALCLAIAAVGLMLLGSVRLQQWLGQKGLSVLSKLTGLVLAAMSAQMVMTGIKSFLAGA